MSDIQRAQARGIAGFALLTYPLISILIFQNKCESVAVEMDGETTKTGAENYPAFLFFVFYFSRVIIAH